MERPRAEDERRKREEWGRGESLIIAQEPLYYEEFGHLGAAMNSELSLLVVELLSDGKSHHANEGCEYISSLAGELPSSSYPQVRRAFSKLVEFQLATASVSQRGNSPKFIQLNDYGQEIAPVFSGFMLDYSASTQPTMKELWGRGVPYYTRECDLFAVREGEKESVPFQHRTTELRVRILDMLVQAARDKVLPATLEHFGSIPQVSRTIIRDTLIQLSAIDMLTYQVEPLKYYFSSHQPSGLPNLPYGRPTTGEYVLKYFLSKQLSDLQSEAVLTVDDAIAYIHERFPQSYFMTGKTLRDNALRILRSFVSQGFLTLQPEHTEISFTKGASGDQERSVRKFLRYLRLIQGRDQDGLTLGRRVLADPKKRQVIMQKVASAAFAEDEEIE